MKIKWHFFEMLWKLENVTVRILFWSYMPHYSWMMRHMVVVIFSFLGVSNHTFTKDLFEAGSSKIHKFLMQIVSLQKNFRLLRCSHRCFWAASLEKELSFLLLRKKYADPSHLLDSWDVVSMIHCLRFRAQVFNTVSQRSSKLHRNLTSVRTKIIKFFLSM